jgi:DNA primase catalytic subunit
VSEAWSWYSQRIVEFQILNGTRERETFFKDAEGHLHIRPMNLFSTQGIEFNLTSTGFDKKPFHFFASVALIDWRKFKNPPEDKKLWKQFREEFNENFESLVKGYDFILDIDSPDLKEAHAVASKVKAVFDSYKLPYFVIFSGSKGFHFHVDWADWSSVALAKSKNPKDWAELSKVVAKNLTHTIGVNFGSEKEIDSIYDLRRVLRVPYSIHPKTSFVALPLDDKQFAEFVPVAFTVPSVHKNIHIMNRGMMKRPGSPEGVKKFFADFSESNQKS